MLELVVPTLEDLWFREKLMADEETMKYNHAWGGTIPFPIKRWKEWYDYWVVNHENQRYYRYLKNENEFVGEIAYHYDPEYDGYVANIIVFSKFRENGYGFGSDGVLHVWYKVYLPTGASGYVRSDLVNRYY